jgi:signal transduction histidine kinase
VALATLARQRRSLTRRVRDGLRQSSQRFGQIASGLAHEIRNPLHALRINLHTLRRSFSGRVKLEQEDVMATIAQSDRAIDSLEELMRDLLRFASFSGGERAEVNIASEVKATLNLMNEDMRRKQVEPRFHLPEQPVRVEIDPSRLRQIVVNLLTFAQHNAGTGGWVEIEVARNGRVADVFVTDSGPTLSDREQSGVFEPFQAPKETGSGLGLALVKHFAEEAGGTARYVRNSLGSRFQVTLPLITAETDG